MTTQTPALRAAHRSLFRYPGGKSWLLNDLRRWLSAQPSTPAHLLEPFAGGGVVSLTAVAEGLVDRATLVELDDAVAAVWQTVLGGDVDALAERISEYALTSSSLRQLLNSEPRTREELAFRTLVRNRVNRAGILAPGAGAMSAGLTSRWYPQTLVRRAQDIAALSERLAFTHGDGLAELRAAGTQPDLIVFIDPPYSAPGKGAGKRLYSHWMLDHEELFSLASQMRGDVLMTYDDTASVRTLAASFGFEVERVAMRNAHHRRMNELLIGRDLHWYRTAVR